MKQVNSLPKCGYCKQDAILYGPTSEGPWTHFCSLHKSFCVERTEYELIGTRKKVKGIVPGKILICPLCGSFILMLKSKMPCCGVYVY